MNTILMYIVNNESEIPTQLQNNTAYYVVGKEVRIIDNMGQVVKFAIETNLETRIAQCEAQIGKIVSHLTSFSV